MTQVNICGNRYQTITKNWSIMYNNVIQALNDLGYAINISPFIELENTPDFVSKGISDSLEDIYVFNHTYIQDLKNKGFNLGSQTLILKPTAPTPFHFTIDTEGYASSSSITYTKPDFENTPYKEFFHKDVKTFIQTKSTKWSDNKDLQLIEVPKKVPDNHVLLIGQMPGDETVTKNSFGSHWNKFCSLVSELKGKYPLVLKVHPSLKIESEKNGTWNYFKKDIDAWVEEGITVYYGFENIHYILPHTKVAILENSTAGLECLYHTVPIISYGYPEYHWVTKDLRHLHKVHEYIQDLSWHNKELSKSWIAWYTKHYQCYNYESTLSRLKELLPSKNNSCT